MEALGEPGAGVVPEATLESSTWARRLRQFQAVTTRLRILKLRQRLSTFCDLVLPIILIVPLVFAYSYYSPDIIHSRPFVNDTTATLVEAATLLANASDKYTQCQDILDEHREKGGNMSAADLGIPLPVNTSDLSDAELEQLQSCTDAQGQLLPDVMRTLISAIVDDGWHGPMPVLNLDEFLLVRKAFTSGLSSSPVLQDLYDSASRVFGWNMMGNLVGSAPLAVAPLTPEVTAFVQHMQREYILFNDTFLGGFSTVEEAEAYLGRSDKEALWALLVFHNGPHAGGADYTIRMNYTSLPPTFVTVDRFGTGAHSNYKLYTTSGFLSLQAAVDAYVLSLLGRDEAASDSDPASESLQSSAWPPSLPPLPEWLLQEDGARNSSWMEWGGVMAVDTYMLRDYYDVVGPILGLVVCIAFVYPLSMFTRAVVEEKETGMKDLMVIMGMDPVLLSLSWASVFYLQVTLSAVFVMITLKASFLPMTSWSLLLVLLLLYLAAETALSLVVAAIFRRARLAAVVGALIHFAAILPRYIFFRTSQSQSLTGKWMASLLAPSALSFAFDDISAYERVGGGVSWSNFREGWFPFSAALLMLAVDTLLYTLLAWSLGHGDTVSAWLQAAWSSAADMLADRQARQAYQRVGSAATMPGGPSESAMELELQAGEDGDIGMTEASPFAAVQRAPPPVVVQGLKKVFGRTTAVHYLDLQMQADRITALLGHNGAGKSTTISMITGMMKPSGGSVRIMGHDMVRETAAARQHVGVCPQSDVLLAKLTVWEHLMLFSAVKGVAGGWGSEVAASHAEHLLAVLGLDRHRDSAATALSGGLKRKLQLAIALLAGSKVVLLDEPSSGMDPLSRRAMWALLQRCKRGRAMLLTTHYMDEADVLSDHISIMSQGRVCAHGSSLQLKQRYGDGYTLTFALGPRSDPQRTVAFMQSQLGGTLRFLRQCGGEVAFSLPTSQTTAFPALLQELERRQAELGIEHFGLSMPTLEEAFLRATAQANPSADASAPSPAAEPAEERAPHSKGPAGADLHQEVELAVLEDGGFPRQAAPSKPQLRRDGRSVLSLTAATGAAAAPPPPPPAPALQCRGERGSVLHAAQCLRAMLAKRWLVMSRDFRGVLFLYGVPLAAVALVMLVLTITDQQFCLGSWPPPPGTLADGSWAGSARALRDDDYQDDDSDVVQQHSGDDGQPFPPPDFPAAPSAGPVADPHCSWTPAGDGVEDGRGLRVRSAYNRTGNSSVVCAELLREQEAGWWPQRAALVLDDEVIRAIPEAVLDALLGTNASAPRGGVTASPEEPASSLEQERGTSAAQVLANSAKLVVAGNASLPVESLAPLLLLGGPLLGAAGALPQVGGLPLAPEVLSGLPQGLPGLQTLLDGGAAAPQLQQGQALALVAQRMALRFQASRPLLVLHNASSYHILPAALSGVRQAMAAAAVQEQGGGSEGQGPQLKVTVHPLPLEDSEALQIDSFLTVLAALFVLVPMMYLTGAFVIQHVDEVRSGAKQQQLHSGCPLPAYWLGHYLADAGIHAVLSLLILAVFAVYDDKATTETAGRMAVTYLVLLLFGAATIPFSYLMSFGFSSPSSAQLGVAVVNMALGVGLVLMSYLMRMLKDTRTLHKHLVPYFRLLPPFNFGEALLNFSKFRFQRQLALAQAHAAASAAAVGTLAGQVAALSPPETHVPDIFEQQYLGRPVHNLLMEAVLYFMLVLLLETVRSNNLLQRLSQHLLEQRRIMPPSWQRLAARAIGRSTEPGTTAYTELAEEEQDLLEAGGALPHAGPPDGDEDRDVAAERSLVESGALDSAALCIRNLRKQFAGRPPKTAVQDLCLSVQAGERLGLLGGNGAGKTTTLSVVSGALLPSGGRVAVAGCDVVDAPSSAKERLGYCPQYSPLVPRLTAEEHLRIYATLRAVPAARQRQVVAWTLQQVGLPAEMARRPAGEYSGGSKRKLSLAIALLGEPSCVLLDEPGCGLDPASRRTVWDVIATSLQPKAGGDAAGAAMVLTTHSMEECEALCSRVGILHAGRLLCLGSIQHLKSRFGAGLVVELRTRPRAAAAALQAFWQQLRGAFPGSCLTESRMLMFKLVLPMPAQPRTSSSARSLADRHESDARGDSACSSAAPAAAQEEAAIQPAAADAQAPTASEPSSSGSDSGGGPAGGWQLSDVFRRMELLMQQHAAVLEAYSVSQPSLEEVFVHLVGEQAAAPAPPADELEAGRL